MNDTTNPNDITHDVDGKPVHPATVFFYEDGTIVPVNKLPEGTEVSPNELAKLQAAGGIVGQYVIYGPGAPSWDPRTDGEVN